MENKYESSPYKMPSLRNCEFAAVFCVDMVSKEWVRVSEIVDVDFQMIGVDWDAEHKKTIQASVDELEKKLAEVRAAL